MTMVQVNDKCDLQQNTLSPDQLKSSNDMIRQSANDSFEDFSWSGLRVFYYIADSMSTEDNRLAKIV